jgi:hypothetical protein
MFFQHFSSNFAFFIARFATLAVIPRISLWGIRASVVQTKSG